MTQPPPYNRFQRQSDYQAAHPLPGPALDGVGLDAEFDRIKTTLDATLANLALIQRDDGLLRNASVSPDTITSALAIMIAGWTIRGPWVTATAYVLKDYVTQGGNGYVCIVAHTSGTFATDLAAAKWALVSTKGDTGLTGPQGAPGATGPAGLSAGGFLNRIINGDFAVDQRNAATPKTFTAGGNVAYCIDRWYASCAGANITGQQAVGTAPNQFGYQFTGAASNSGIVFGQRIESGNIYDLAGQTVTVQVMLSASAPMTVTWKALYANTVDAWGTKAASGSGTETQISTGTIAVTTTPTKYTFQVALPANAVNGVDVEFSVAGLAAAATLKFQSVQLEGGTIANTFERLPFDARLTRCQRYYEKSYNMAVVPAAVTTSGSVAFAGTGAGINISTPFKVTKRATPTFTIYSPATGATGNANANVGGDFAPDGLVASQNHHTLSKNATSLGNGFSWHWTADAEL